MLLGCRFSASNNFKSEEDHSIALIYNNRLTHLVLVRELSVIQIRWVNELLFKEEVTRGDITQWEL